MESVPVGKIGTTWETAHFGGRSDERPPTWGTAHLGEGVRWEKMNPDGKKWTQIEEMNPDGKTKPRWERENLPIASSEARARKGEAGLHISLERAKTCSNNCLD